MSKRKREMAVEDEEDDEDYVELVEAPPPQPPQPPEPQYQGMESLRPEHLEHLLSCLTLGDTVSLRGVNNRLKTQVDGALAATEKRLAAQELADQPKKDKKKGNKKPAQEQAADAAGQPRLREAVVSVSSTTPLEPTVLVKQLLSMSSSLVIKEAPTAVGHKQAAKAVLGVAIAAHPTRIKTLHVCTDPETKLNSKMLDTTLPRFSKVQDGAFPMSAPFLSSIAKLNDLTTLTITYWDPKLSPSHLTQLSQLKSLALTPADNTATFDYHAGLCALRCLQSYQASNVTHTFSGKKVTRPIKLMSVDYSGCSNSAAFTERLLSDTRLKRVSLPYMFKEDVNKLSEAPKDALAGCEVLSCFQWPAQLMGRQAVRNNLITVCVLSPKDTTPLAQLATCPRLKHLLFTLPVPSHTAAVPAAPYIAVPQGMQFASTLQSLHLQQGRQNLRAPEVVARWPRQDSFFTHYDNQGYPAYKQPLQATPPEWDGWFHDDSYLQNQRVPAHSMPDLRDMLQLKHLVVIDLMASLELGVGNHDVFPVGDPAAAGEVVVLDIEEEDAEPPAQPRLKELWLLFAGVSQQSFELLPLFEQVQSVTRMVVIATDGLPWEAEAQAFDALYSLEHLGRLRDVQLGCFTTGGAIQGVLRRLLAECPVLRHAVFRLHPSCQEFRDPSKRQELLGTLNDLVCRRCAAVCVKVLYMEQQAGETWRKEGDVAGAAECGLGWAL